MSYVPTPRYPFELTWSNQQAGSLIESEMYFEGVCYAFEDDDTQAIDWTVEVVCTGFTQYQDGKVLAEVKDIKVNNWKVSDLAAFEAACIDKAAHQYKYKEAA